MGRQVRISPLQCREASIRAEGRLKLRVTIPGFRFAPHGDKLLSINEGGVWRGASAQSRDLWVRAGYMNNRSGYTNFLTGRKEAGNYCVYVLSDFQLTQTNREHPNPGLYLGGSAETAPKALNAYARYY
jgi:porin